ncbi:NF-kappa-B inhibitor zeta-like [Pristis pectinata]|uniref:NF-kappa-B inhibitor zeta-like n=1 Tax=Pristis pectinata TaxID=685728 RepID=UPI00223D8AA2|nr:NF-kappa-B inhibitor zeta-like [Pristis pectinata]
MERRERGQPRGRRHRGPGDWEVGASNIPRRKGKTGQRRPHTVKELLQYHRDREQTVQEPPILKRLADLDELDMVNDVIAKDLISDRFPTSALSQEPGARFGFPVWDAPPATAPDLSSARIHPASRTQVWDSKSGPPAEPQVFLPLSAQGTQYSAEQLPPSLLTLGRSPWQDSPPSSGADAADPSGPPGGWGSDGGGDPSVREQLAAVEGSVGGLSPRQLLMLDSNQRTLLHQAVALSSRPLVYVLARRMSEMGSLDAQDISGKTALHYAVERNKPLIVLDLLSLGANVCVQDHFGKTPLHICVEDCLISVLQVITFMGQDGAVMAQNTMDNNGLTPMHYAVEILAYPDLIPEVCFWKQQACNIISSLIMLGASDHLQEAVREPGGEGSLGAGPCLSPAVRRTESCQTPEGITLQ